MVAQIQNIILQSSIILNIIVTQAEVYELAAIIIIVLATLYLMHSQTNSELHQIDQHNQVQTNQTPKSSNTAEHRLMNIPHIAKRMNKVETYVKNFNNLSVSVSRRNILDTLLPTSISKMDHYSDTLEQNTRKKESRSVFLSEIDHKKSQKDILTSLIDTTLNSKDAMSKINSLNRLEQTYIEMKNNIRVNNHILPTISNFRQQNKTDNSRLSIKIQNVTQEQIDNHIKSTIVQQQGKRYFGDLYLLKKGRDKVMHSLEKIGKHDSEPYEKIVQDLKSYNTIKHSSEHITRNKILQERQVKKNKMMTNKNMHWNVYYDMFALSKLQKSKLDRACHFGNRYCI